MCPSYPSTTFLVKHVLTSANRKILCGKRATSGLQIGLLLRQTFFDAPEHLAAILFSKTKQTLILKQNMTRTKIMLRNILSQNISILLRVNSIIQIFIHIYSWFKLCFFHFFNFMLLIGFSSPPHNPHPTPKTVIHWTDPKVLKIKLIPYKRGKHFCRELYCFLVLFESRFFER